MLVLLLLYTLAGFFLAPWVAKRQIPAILSETLERPVQVESVYVNPWVLSTEVRGLRIDDGDGSTLAAFDRLYVNFQLSSLFRWAFTFRDIELEGLRGHFVRRADGGNNISDLPVLAGEPEAEEADTGVPPRLVIHRFSLDDGALSITDHTRATAFETTLAPIGIELEGISTLPEKSGNYQLVAESDEGARLAWQGELQIQPLLLTGQVDTSGPWPQLAYRYFEDLLNVRVTQGTLDLGLAYRVTATDDGNIQASLETEHLKLEQLKVLDKNSGDPLLDLAGLEVGGARLAWPEQSLHIEQIALASPQLRVQREADGNLDIAQILVPTEGGDEPDEEPSAEQTPLSSWALTLGEFAISDLGLAFTDHTLRDPAPVRIQALQLNVRDLSNRPDARFPFRASLVPAAGGSVELRGELGALPQPALDANLEAEGLPLSLAQPWLGDLARVRLASGILSGTAELRVRDDEPFAAEGDLAVRELTVDNSEADEKLLGWDKVSLDGIRYSMARKSLKISGVAVDAPYLRLHINEDQSTNFHDVLIAGDPDTADPEDSTDNGQSDESRERPEASGGDPGLHLVVGRATIQGGVSDFSDLSLPLPFGTRISQLSGQVSTLDTASSEPASLELEGQVADYGLARVRGEMHPTGPARYTDVSVLFRNIVVPDLSPYVIKFAGRRVAEGRMDLDLAYTIEEGRLSGHNEIVISDFRLGERVDYEGAMDLPLDLAVALLKGPNGKIDINLPVSGNIGDPTFSFGSVVRNALGNLITNVVTAPFKLLGSLVGADSEDFHQVEFEAGRAQLTPPERENIAKLAQALEMRPALGLKVPGSLDREQDVAALKHIRVEEQVESALASGDGDEQGYGERRREVLEALFRGAFPEAELEPVRDAHRKPVDGEEPDGPRELDRTAYLAALEQRLIDAQAISDAELQALATARAEAVVDLLTRKHGLDPGRIRRTDTPADTPARREGWIQLELDVESLSAGG